MRSTVWRRALALAGVALIISTTAVYAGDDLVMDPDGMSPFVEDSSAPSRDLGDVCLNTDAGGQVLLAAIKGSGQVWSNSATITVQPGARTGTNAADVTVGVGAGADATIVLPSDWSSKPNGTLSSDTAVGTFSVNSAATGPHSANAKWSGSGAGTASTQDTPNLHISWNVVSCVANTPPDIAADADPVTVNEGAVASNTGTISDADSDPVVLSASVGNVTDNGDGTWSWSWLTSDGPADTKTVTITADDGEAQSTATFSLVVNNVAPSATFGNDGPVNEGTSFNLSLTSPSDPSSVDTAAGFTYAFDCGDGSGYSAFGGTTSATCPTNDNGVRSVGAKIQDKDGGVSTYTGSVTVNNVAPSATFGNDGPVDEGTSFNLSLTSPSDPSSVDTAAGFTYAFDCDDGSGYSAFGGTTSATCPTNDNGVRSVGAKIQDKDGGVSTYTGLVTVNNVAPTILSLTPNPLIGIVGMPVTFTGAATDPSSLDAAAGFSWSFDTGSGFGSFGFSNQITMTFAACGSYTVSAKARDKDLGISAPFTSSSVSVYNASILQPLMAGVYNLVQKGQVVPVKITVGCGGFISGLSPLISVRAGDYDPTVDPSDPTYTVVSSVSAADTSGVMREVDNQYIYNLQVPNGTTGALYTIQIRPFGASGASMYAVIKIRK